MFLKYRIMYYKMVKFLVPELNLKKKLLLKKILCVSQSHILWRPASQCNRMGFLDVLYSNFIIGTAISFGLGLSWDSA